MDELFPSEIARLVLGYLKESKCEKSWNMFLEESSNLLEYCELYKRGRLYPTNVNGKSLLEILNEYCVLKKDAENNCSKEFSGNTFKEKCKIILEEIVTNAAENVLLKYFPSSCDNNHHKDNSPLDVTKAIYSSGLSGKNCIEYGDTAEKSAEIANSDHTLEISSHNFDSNMELNVADCNADQSCEQPGSRSNATRYNLNLIESSVSDSIYLQEIIKVEKDSDNFSVLDNSPEKNISDIRCHATELNELSNSFSECNKDLNSRNNSKVAMENHSGADSTSGRNENADKTISKQTDSAELEIIKTVKLEPLSEVETNKNTTTGSSCLQNSSIIASHDSSTVEISQTALCDTQSTIGQFSNLVNNISFSTNQSGYALQATPFSNQPVTVNDLSFSSVPTYIVPNYSSNTPYVQNNAQYSFVINTPTSWKEATVGGFSLNLPSIHSNNIGPVLTSVDSIRSDNTPSVPTVCVNNALSTAVDPIRNSPSGAGVSINTISTPTLTTVDTVANGQPLTVSTVPSNVSSFVNTAGTVHTILNSNLTSSKKTSKSNRKLMNKHTPNKKHRRRRNYSELQKEKEAKKNKLLSQIQSSAKDICNKSKRKLPSLHQSSSLESGNKMDKIIIPNEANFQSKRPKIARRRVK